VNNTNELTSKEQVMNRIFVCILITSIFFSACNLGRKKETIVYHKFTGQTWNRFEKVVFKIPVESVNEPYDILFFAHHSPAYEYDNLDFALIMNTPSGEERINQYHFEIKKKYGGFSGNCTKDSCEAIIPLKRGMRFTQKGMLEIEVENLVPRLEVKELFGIGIKLVQVP
jgi:gliding motility-associated lipoprotein GldH